ncbi:Transposase, Ptta/En/Spm, plant [Corchorus olitorius]|uniref:Transposase, Ptta/En/Spm, plant n=1 Tax=Corchorus olitorius TaxID=93759 RepID=A0A1R3KNY0_9ROSI|nr:Transposase, Ptta/En/Spm, plant [Corchorus olitorius]
MSDSEISDSLRPDDLNPEPDEGELQDLGLVGGSDQQLYGCTTQSESEEDDIIADGLEFDYSASDNNADESEDIDMDKGVKGKIAKKGGTKYIRRNNISRYLKSSKISFPATDHSPSLTNSVSPTPSLPPVMSPTHPPSLTNPSPPILPSGEKESGVPGTITTILRSYYGGRWSTWLDVPEKNRKYYWRKFQNKYKWPQSEHARIEKLFFSTAGRAFSTMMNKARKWAMRKAKTTNIAETKEQEVKNRLTLKDGSISKHTSGSIPMLLHGRKLKEKRYVSDAEVFDKTHKRANGEFVDNKSKNASKKYADEMVVKYGDAAANHEFNPEVWSKVVGGVGHGYLYGFGRGDPRLILGTPHDSSMSEPCNNEESSQSAHIGTQAEIEEIVKQVLDGVLSQRLQDALRNLGFQLPNPPTSGSTPRDDGVDNDEGRGNGDGLEGQHDA